MASALWRTGNGDTDYTAVETVSDPRQCAGAQPDQPVGCVSGCTKTVSDIVITDQDHPAAMFQLRGHPTTVHDEELHKL